jgi:hypothetical protein
MRVRLPIALGANDAVSVNVDWFAYIQLTGGNLVGVLAVSGASVTIKTGAVLADLTNLLKSLGPDWLDGSSAATPVIVNKEWTEQLSVNTGTFVLQAVVVAPGIVTLAISTAFATQAAAVAALQAFGADLGDRFTITDGSPVSYLNLEAMYLIADLAGVVTLTGIDTAATAIRVKGFSTTALGQFYVNTLS